jgi:hypothetical protein
VINKIERLLQLKIRWESRSYDTAAISAKAKDFTNFCRPAAQQLLRQRLRWWGAGTQTGESGLTPVIPVIEEHRIEVAVCVVVQN